MHFKKRRVPGPSKNVKKVQRRASDGGGGPSLQRIHSDVNRLTIEISVTSPQGAAVLEETRRFSASDCADFTCPCPGTCGVGVFRFNEKISEMVAARETASEVSGACQVEGYGGVPQTCGYAIKCRIDIAY